MPDPLKFVRLQPVCIGSDTGVQCYPGLPIQRLNRVRYIEKRLLNIGIGYSIRKLIAGLGYNRCNQGGNVSHCVANAPCEIENPAPDVIGLPRPYQSTRHIVDMHLLYGMFAVMYDDGLATVQCVADEIVNQAPRPPFGTVDPANSKDAGIDTVLV